MELPSERRARLRAEEEAKAAAFMERFEADEKSAAKLPGVSVEAVAGGDALEVADHAAAAERAELASQEEAGDRLFGQA